MLHYTLPPEILARAHRLYLWRTALSFAAPLWSIAFLYGILHFHLAARFRDWAGSLSRRQWLRGLGFLPLLLATIVLLRLPVAVLAHHVSLVYGQSVEGWRAWFTDWSKSLGIYLLAGTVVLTILFALIRVSPRRWWVWFWLLSLPAEVLAVLVLPVVIDPLFYHFEPLEASHPALVSQLERVIAKTEVRIPPSRIFLMRASAKVTGANAYVTGFGASKRVVVWDTTLKSCPEDEILVIFGHELGHYVLHHIRRGMILGAMLSFFLIWAAYGLAKFLIRRLGGRWRIQSLEDWAAAALLLFLFAVLSFLAEPIVNGISRSQEHQADVFGIEAVHGVVPNPQAAAARSFQRLGEQSLEYPWPGAFVVFWTYTHPPIASREAFASQYDPWRPGHHPRYFQ